jgi:hypothetical protein
MSIIFSFGKFGGFYYFRGNTIRICIGWMAVTILFKDIDIQLLEILDNIRDSK